MKRVQLEPGYALSQRPYRETSCLVEVFTEQFGRVGLVARAARGPRSKQRGLLQPFRRLLLSWSEGGDLGTLTGVEAAGAGAVLQGEGVFSGWYLNELLLRLVQRRDPHAALYRKYAETLAALDGADPQASLRIFEKVLLAELGYGLQLPEAVRADAWYAYDAELGPRLLVHEQPGAYRGAHLLELAQERFESTESLRAARRLLREALEPHLGDKALQTPRILRAVRSGLEAT